MTDRSDSPSKRRRFRRRTVRIVVEYLGETGLCCDTATTLGAGGLFVETETPVPIGASLKLRFRLPGRDEEHHVEGRVAWSRGGVETRGTSPGMGIEFTDRVAVKHLARELEDLD